MTVRIILVLIRLAAGMRAAFQVWNSIRRRRGRRKSCSGQTIERRTEPRLYWLALMVQMALVATYLGIAAEVALGLLRRRR